MQSLLTLVKQHSSQDKKQDISLLTTQFGWAYICSPTRFDVTSILNFFGGTITGTVRDNRGAVVPGAAVTLTDTDTGLVLQTKTDRSGFYFFSPVKIGNYKVSATSPGFQSTLQENLQLNIQERLNVPLTLKPGAVSQTVTVSTAPPLLQTESGSVGQVMSTPHDQQYAAGPTHSRRCALDRHARQRHRRLRGERSDSGTEQLPARRRR
ncbi:MAG: carboxypeptidase-like regulatory domain-containing protein [Acidobacteriaceae bacterium]